MFGIYHSERSDRNSETVQCCANQFEVQSGKKTQTDWHFLSEGSVNSSKVASDRKQKTASSAFGLLIIIIIFIIIIIIFSFFRKLHFGTKKGTLDIAN